MSRTDRKKATPRKGKLLAEELQRARRAKHWEVKETALRCGYTPQQWRNFEDGKCLPPVTRIQPICDALDVDVRQLFSLWALESLDDGTSEQLRQILGNLNKTRIPTTHYSMTDDAPMKELLERVREIPMDDGTSRLITDLAEAIALYRKSLTAPIGTIKDLRVEALNGDIESICWYPVETKRYTLQHVVGMSQVGLGYFATLIRIEPSFGAYHQHLEDRYLDAGTEFFSVVLGQGVGFFQHPVNSQWVSYDLGRGSAGLYRGSRGHAYINCGPAPLLLYIVCVPFPPALAIRDTGEASLQVGYAQGIEFRIGDVEETSLPAELKYAICNAFQTQLMEVSI